MEYSKGSNYNGNYRRPREYHEIAGEMHRQSWSSMHSNEMQKTTLLGTATCSNQK